MIAVFQIKNQASEQWLSERFLCGSRKGTETVIVENQPFLVCHFVGRAESVQNKEGLHV